MKRPRLLKQLVGSTGCILNGNEILCYNHLRLESKMSNRRPDSTTISFGPL